MATLAALREAKRKHDEDVRIAVDAIPATKLTDGDITAVFANVDRIISKASQKGRSRMEIVFRVDTYNFVIMAETARSIEFEELTAWWKGALGTASASEPSNLTRRNSALIDLLKGLARLWRERSDVPLQLRSSVDKKQDALSGVVTWTLDWSDPVEAPVKKARTRKANKK